MKRRGRIETGRGLVVERESIATAWSSHLSRYQTQHLFDAYTSCTVLEIQGKRHELSDSNRIWEFDTHFASLNAFCFSRGEQICRQLILVSSFRPVGSQKRNKEENKPWGTNHAFIDSFLDLSANLVSVTQSNRFCKVQFTRPAAKALLLTSKIAVDL